MSTKSSGSEDASELPPLPDDGPPPPPPEPTVARDAVSSDEAGMAHPEAEGRLFPCDSCGADLLFHVGVQSLQCQYCGYTKEIELGDDADIAEQDLETMLARIAEKRVVGSGDENSEVSEVHCEACGATVAFTGTLTSSECPYCGVPIQRGNIHRAKDRIAVDGVLPFLVERETARANLAQWIKKLWFAPNDFKKRGIQGRFNGVYLPYWTFDSMTSNRYTGMRGDHYYVTVGSGKNKRRVRKTRWSPRAGAFQRFFDDVLVVAGRGLPRNRLRALEPWPLDQCVSFDQRVLAGFMARTYDVELPEGFSTGKERMEEAIRAEVNSRIGGDVQKITSLSSNYDALTFKHLLLPVWMLAYRYKEKTYQVVVNAATGEVQGDRPWSAWKIAFAVVAGLVVAGVVWWFARAEG